MALIGVAGLTTALISLIYSGRGKPYATFLVVSQLVYTTKNKANVNVTSYQSSRSRTTQVGDWGRLGQYNQSLVAEAMAFRANKLHPDFVLGMGDNFYPSTFQDRRPGNALRQLYM